MEEKGAKAATWRRLMENVVQGPFALVYLELSKYVLWSLLDVHVPGLHVTEYGGNHWTGSYSPDGWEQRESAWTHIQAWLWSNLNALVRRKCSGQPLSIAQVKRTPGERGITNPAPAQQRALGIPFQLNPCSLSDLSFASLWQPALWPHHQECNPQALVNSDRFLHSPEAALRKPCGNLALALLPTSPPSSLF